MVSLEKRTRTVIIDYGSGNIRSVKKAVEKVNRGSLQITNKPDEVADGSHFILPGVGAFKSCRDGLDSFPELVSAITKQVIENKKPFLGICVGMQLMATQGLEHSATPGLNWIPGNVIKLKNVERTMKIPHMGWNEVNFIEKDHPVLRGLESGKNAYFVHSYYFDVQNKNHILAGASYGREIPAIIGCENLLGTQFHPEKSQGFGLSLMESFLNWNGQI